MHTLIYTYEIQVSGYQNSNIIGHRNSKSLRNEEVPILNINSIDTERCKQILDI